MPENATSAPRQFSSHPDSNVEVARITARQAIIVAVITSVAGLLGGMVGYFANHPAKPPEHAVAYTEHRISIDGVRLEAGEEGSQHLAIRVMVDVNGQAYSYPSRALWADIGPNMSKEEFPLVSAETYKVHFAAYLRSQDGRVDNLQSQELLETSPGSSRFYGLRPVNSGLDEHGPFLVIMYHVQ
jgi:hypothetical protein